MNNRKFASALFTRVGQMEQALEVSQTTLMILKQRAEKEGDVATLNQIEMTERLIVAALAEIEV